MSNLRFSCAALALSACLVAAANIRWLATEYDFGSFKEAEGPRTGMVRFVNDGPDATMIQRVKSTCGCTVARYTDGIIAPGDTATVWMEYNPTGRPGRFEKTVKVYTGENGDLTSIRIKGTVIGAPATLHASYPDEFGPLRFSSTQLRLGAFNYGLSRHEYIYGYNQSADTLHISWGKLPPSLSLGVSTKSVAPGDLFTLSAYFNSRDQGEIGSLEFPIELSYTSAAGSGTVPLTVTANVRPDTSRYTEEELRQAPSILLYPTVIELGSVKRGSRPVEVRFAFTNEGKTPLHVQRVHVPGAAGMLEVKSLSRTVNPGKTGVIKGRLDVGSLASGPFAVEIEVVSDDPLHPAAKVRAIGVIAE